MAARVRLLKLLAVGGVAFACAGYVAAAPGSAAQGGHSRRARTSGTSPPPAIRVPTSATNKRAAVRDAGRLLGRAVLPPGAVRLGAEPSGDGRLLVKPPAVPSGEVVDRYGWWKVQGTLGSVIAFVQAHRPAGSKSSGYSSETGPRIPANQGLSFAFGPIAGVIWSRSLSYLAVALSGGGTGIRVDAQETWIVTRSKGERVPAGVHEVDVTSVSPAKVTIVSRSLTSSSKVREIVSLIDAMPTVQPGVYSCPLLGVGPVVTLYFRATAGGPVLARASLTDDGFPSGPCNAVDFSIGGRRQKPLIGGNFLSRVQHLLGIPLR